MKQDKLPSCPACTESRSLRFLSCIQLCRPCRHAAMPPCRCPCRDPRFQIAHDLLDHANASNVHMMKPTHHDLNVPRSLTPPRLHAQSARLSTGQDHESTVERTVRAGKRYREATHCPSQLTWHLWSVIVMSVAACLHAPHYGHMTNTKAPTAPCGACGATSTAQSSRSVSSPLSLPKAAEPQHKSKPSGSPSPRHRNFHVLARIFRLQLSATSGAKRALAILGISNLTEAEGTSFGLPFPRRRARHRCTEYSPHSSPISTPPICPPPIYSLRYASFQHTPVVGMFLATGQLVEGVEGELACWTPG